jgi:hypothetical protein
LYDRKQSGPFGASVFFERAIMAPTDPLNDRIAAPAVIDTTVRLRSSTAVVDNFVGNRAARRAKPRQHGLQRRLLKT